MPKRIDDQLKARAVRMVNDHQGECSSLTAAAVVVAKQLGVGKESVRRWVVQSQVDGGQRQGATTAEIAEIKALKAKVRRLEEDHAILRSATVSSSGNSSPATADHGLRRPHEQVGATRSTRSVGCCVSRAVRSPHGPTGPGNTGGRWRLGA